MSSIYCLQKAEWCEAMARTSSSVADSLSWLILAAYCRGLAEQATLFERLPEPTDQREDRSPTQQSVLRVPNRQ